MLIVPAKPFDNLSVKEELINEVCDGMGHSAFFKLGRHALLYTLEHFGVRPSDKVLCPAYCCKSAIEPIMALGYDIVFIDVTADLNIDLHLLIQEIEMNNCKAIILPDYFGLFDTVSDTIYEECKYRNVIVIKDCAHSYLSYLYATKKHFCDAVILSMRKSVNIHYGGVAIITEKKDIHKSNIEETFLSRVKFELFKRAEQILILSGVNIYGKTITFFKNLLNIQAPNKKLNKIIASDYEIMGVESKYLLNRSYYSLEVANLRRMNFLKLKNLLATSGVTSPFINLNDKVPQVYPIYGDIEFCSYLRNKGVGATLWPFSDIPTEVKKALVLYPNTNFFLKHLICLPIHQGLSDTHLKKISDLIHKYVAVKQ